MTAWTIENPDIQGHLLPMSAGATGLTRIGRVDFDTCSASFFRFTRQSSLQVAPATIQDALRQVMVAHHVADAQVFEGDPVVSFDEAVRQLVQKVLTLGLRVRGDALQHAHSPPSIGPALLAPRHARDDGDFSDVETFRRAASRAGDQLIS